MFIACTTEAFIRDSASVSTPISSLLFVLNSPASMLPRLTWSAMRESLVTRRMTIVYSMMLSSTITSTNTPSSDSMNVRNDCVARAIGTAIGTDTTCAPMMSLSFQPKPLELP